MNEGWICPVCRRGVAPSEKHCDHGGAHTAPTLPTFPIGPFIEPYPTTPAPWPYPYGPWTTISGGTSLGRFDGFLWN